MMTLIGAGLWFAREDHFAILENGNGRSFFPIAHLLLGIGLGVLIRETFGIRRRAPNKPKTFHDNLK